MSRRNKLVKFAELLTFPNVYESFDPQQPALTGKDGAQVELQGAWAARHFGNDRPLTLELACGRGEYSLGLARMFPERNFIGVDVKGARIWKGAKIALSEQLGNVAFLCTRIEVLPAFFAPDEISEIWITFPDPFLANKKASRRLTSPRFLDDYRSILQPQGIIHLKTDEIRLYDYTLEVLAARADTEVLYQNNDIYAAPLFTPELSIHTYYEKMHLAEQRTIKYLQFRFI